MAPDPEQWPQSVYFEGERLPAFAIALDVLGTDGYLPGLPPDTSEWLWRWSICVGCPRQAASADVVRHATAALRLLTAHRARVLRRLPENVPPGTAHDGVDASPGAICADWEATLGRIIAIAKGRDTCAWHGGELSEGWEDRLRKQGEAVLRMLDRAGADEAG